MSSLALGAAVCGTVSTFLSSIAFFDVAFRENRGIVPGLAPLGDSVSSDPAFQFQYLL